MSLIVKSKEEAIKEIKDSMENKNTDGFINSLQTYGEAFANELRQRMLDEMDGVVLADRGFKRLTQAETKFANVVKTMANARLNGLQMALQDTDVVMPETIINKVFEDITVEHPLLAEIDFQNTTYSTKWLMSKLAIQKASWGAVDAEASKELEASFLEMDMTLLSLIAYIPVSWALLDLGPSWIITYVVTMLKEALANGLEDGIINGNGNGKEPVGLIKNTEGKYNSNLAAQDFTSLDKEKVTVNKLNPVTIGKILDTLSTTPNGNRRAVSEIILIVNPADYYTKIYPAITVQGTNGSYVQHALPYGVRVVQSSFVAKNTAIAYLKNGYWMGLGQSGMAGKFLMSDDFKFTSRQRYYMIELYANGQPKDNNVSVVLDITNLKPAAIAIETASAGE